MSGRKPKPLEPAEPLEPTPPAPTPAFQSAGAVACLSDDEPGGCPNEKQASVAVWEGALPAGRGEVLQASAVAPDLDELRLQLLRVAGAATARLLEVVSEERDSVRLIHVAGRAADIAQSLLASGAPPAEEAERADKLAFVRRALLGSV